MPYSSFTWDLIEETLGVKNQRGKLFSNIQAVEPSKRLQEALAFAEELPLASEKAKSEWIVAPILAELRVRNNAFFTIYSGDSLNVDEDLNGECDFILAKDTHSFSLNYPIFQIVEAKKHDIESGLPQCAAQMIGAKRFNQKKGIELEKVYGCVTTGDDWLFLCLENEIKIDTKKYYLGEIKDLLGVLQHILDYYKANL